MQEFWTLQCFASSSNVMFFKDNDVVKGEFQSLHQFLKTFPVAQLCQITYVISVVIFNMTVDYLFH